MNVLDRHETAGWKIQRRRRQAHGFHCGQCTTDSRRKEVTSIMDIADLRKLERWAGPGVGR